jgi:hypothetical protein
MTPHHSTPPHLKIELASPSPLPGDVLFLYEKKKARMFIHSVNLY